MDDLISRAAAIDAVLSEERYCERNMDSEATAAVQMARFKLQKVPVVDAVPVEWLRNIILTCDDEESNAAYKLLHKWNDEHFTDGGKNAVEK